MTIPICTPIGSGSCCRNRLFFALPPVTAVVAVGSHDSRDEVEHSGLTTLGDRVHSDPWAGSRRLATGRAERGGMLPAPWGACQWALLPVFDLLALGIGVVLVGIVQALVRSDMDLMGLDALVLPVGMTASIVGWIALRYRRVVVVGFKTFSDHDTAKLDKAVNAFIEGESIEVVKLSYHSNSFSYVVFLEYEPR